MSTSDQGPRGGLSRIPFTVEAEAQIKALAGWMTAFGAIGIAAGVLDFVNILWLPLTGIGHALQGVVRIVLGIWSLQAAAAFKAVATTDVADQAYLVRGFAKLRSVFLIQGISILLG